MANGFTLMMSDKLTYTCASIVLVAVTLGLVGITSLVQEQILEHQVRAYCAKMKDPDAADHAIESSKALKFGMVKAYYLLYKDTPGQKLAQGNAEPGHQ